MKTMSNTAAVRPTKKQKELLAYIETFITEHGYSPSYREIMNGLKYTSVATVALHVGNLIKRGHLRKRDHSARSLEVVKAGAPVAAQPAESGVATDAAPERWLLDQVSRCFASAEAGDAPEQAQLDDLAILLGALRVLGLETAADGFMERFTRLQTTLAGSSSAV